jgi:hypothetical protein
VHKPNSVLVAQLNGDVAQTFLVDGFVAGMWNVESGTSKRPRRAGPVRR